VRLSAPPTESPLQEVRAHAHRLKSVDVNVSDEDIIVVLTAGLPETYSTVVISFDAIDPAKLTLDFVITRLLNEESRQALPRHLQVEDMFLKDSVASVAFKKATKTGGSTIQCFYCLGAGHFANKCPVKEKDIKDREETGRQKLKELTTAALTWKLGDDFSDDDSDVAM
jgi:hypothetical protein